MPPKNPDIELHIYGVVQGVGFRPFVYRLAQEFSINGNVANTADGVVIQLYQPGKILPDFINALQNQAPVMAKITAITQHSCRLAPNNSAERSQSYAFEIQASRYGAVNSVIPPDTTICPDCLQELFDPQDRRYKYPFINCTNCGPRFTIIAKIPYDRPNTSMHSFTMCADCLAEYENPANRRFHAEPNACHVCGPSLSWHDGKGKIPGDPISQTITALRNGKIVAIRGLGGFHLAVDAQNETAVARLRKRKNRPAKPLAVMMADLAVIRRYCHVSIPEQDFISSQERPIVLLRKKRYDYNHTPISLAANLAPQISDLGCMLPYTPLHYLIFAEPSAPEALVMTSGNKSATPICADNDLALTELLDIANFFLLHNRDILTRADDSLGRIINNTPQIIRRSRGYVPSTIPLPHKLPQIIACGAELKSTFCLTKANNAFLSQHIGDLTNTANLDFYSENIQLMEDLFEIRPVAAICDAHPDYLSSRYAKSLNLPQIKVQHHHAHAAAVMVEHNLPECLAVVMDGVGWGTDNTIWGGELLWANYTNYRRLGHLQCIPLPGGDRTAREGWRLGLTAGWLNSADTKSPALRNIPPAKRQVIYEMLTKKINTPQTSSAGRYFDMVASILGIRQFSHYEGQAAMELEAVAELAMNGDSIEDVLPRKSPLPICIDRHNKTILTTPMLQKMLELSNKEDSSNLALYFHLWLCHSVAALIQMVAPAADLPLVLAGGCMQNKLLFTGLSCLLRQQKFKIYSGEMVPVNDGGLALGQAVIGGSLYVSGCSHASD